MAVIPDWKDFESASPKAKLRLVACRCGVNPEFNKHPWTTAWELLSFRNLIAHAKRKHLKKEGVCSESDYAKIFGARLDSDVEKMITPHFAAQSADAVEQIIKVFNKALNGSQFHELNYSGHESFAEILKDRPA